MPKSNDKPAKKDSSNSVKNGNSNKMRESSPSRQYEAPTAIFPAVKADRRSAETEGYMRNNTFDSSKKEEVNINRQKSDRRFWARLASLAAIVPAYLVLLVCAVLLPRSTVSNIEKRNLSTMPEFSWDSYWSGQYTADVAHYFDDTVPFRDTLKQAASRFSGLFGIKYNDVQVSGTMEVVNTKPKDDNKNSGGKNDSASSGYGGSLSSGDSKDKDKDKNKDKDTDTEKEKQVKGEEIAEGVYANGVIVVYQDGHYRAMSMYGGGYGETYALALNEFANDLPGVQVYSLVAPTASEFYTPKNFSDYNASQEDDIIAINDMLQNVKGINVCPALLSHKKETIYTRTDHHWMSLGAYYAAKEFASAAGVSFLDISQYTRLTKPDYVGTLYTFSGNNADLLNDPEDFIYYVPKKKDYKTEYYDYAFNYQFEGDLFADIQISSEYYSTFINGDAFSVKITTGTKNGRRCLVVKDSYGDALVPFLTGSFEEVYVVDMRYFERNLVDFAREMDITDLLFTCCSYSAVGPNADNLEVIRTSGYTGSVDTSSQDNSNDNNDTNETTNDDNTPEETPHVDDIPENVGGYTYGYEDDGEDELGVFAGGDETYDDEEW